MKDLDLAGIYLQDIKNFIRAADSQNFSAVARENDITSSAVSKSITRLEQATNLILFTRNHGKIVLTPAGRHLRESLEGYIYRFEQAAAGAHSIQEGITRRLSVGIPNENEMQNLVDSFIMLREKHKNTDLSAGVYSFRELRSRLAEGSLDVVITSFFEHAAFDKTGGIRWKPVCTMPLCAFVPDTNPLSKKKTLSVGDLKAEKFVMYSPDSVPEYNRLIKELCEPFGFTPLIGKYSDNPGAFVTELIFGNCVFIGDELIKGIFPDSIKCYPLENTRSGSIIAWDAARESRIVKDFIRIFLNNQK